MATEVWQYRTGHPVQSDDVDVGQRGRLLGRERLRHAGRYDSSIINQDIDATRLRDNCGDSPIDRLGSGDIERDDFDALASECVCVGTVLGFRIAHRGKHLVASVWSVFATVGSETPVFLATSRTACTASGSFEAR